MFAYILALILFVNMFIASAMDVQSGGIALLWQLWSPIIYVIGGIIALSYALEGLGYLIRKARGQA